MVLDGAVQGKAMEGATKHAVEAITNIRTVVGLRCERQMIDLYTSQLAKPFRSGECQLTTEFDLIQSSSIHERVERSLRAPSNILRNDLHHHFNI